MPFTDSLDIANRALQLLGVNSILSITEDSTNNSEASNAYDKLRRPELRRNVWRFAIRTAVLRALDTTTMLLVPALYDATKTYLPGEIVRDSNGLMWICQSADNKGNTPGGNNEAWDMYFGPMTADLWDSTTSYFAGELAYVIDASAVEAIHEVHDGLGARNITLEVARATAELRDQFDSTGLTALIGAEHFHATVMTAVNTCLAAPPR